MFGWQGEGRVTHEIVELLSKSTEDDDHGATYRTLASFVEDVLVAQRWWQVEHFRRLESGPWLLTLLEGDDAVLDLPALAQKAPLAIVLRESHRAKAPPHAASSA